MKARIRLCRCGVHLRLCLQMAQRGFLMMWLICSRSRMLLARLPVKLDCARAVKKIITFVKEVKRPTEPGLHDTFEPCHEKT